MSRLRRRAKRAEARAAAKAALSKPTGTATEDVAVQINDPDVHNNQQTPAEEVTVPDVFCPDKDYLQQHVSVQGQDAPPPPHQEFLPQQDGHAADLEKVVNHPQAENSEIYNVLKIA